LDFFNPELFFFKYINQLVKVYPRNIGSVEVSGSIPLGPPFTGLVAIVEA
jgi:hypothetical protein